jgi:branched-chain amino acid transport system ATP-binding protein
MPALEIRDLNAFYGPSHVLFDFNLDVQPGETVALVGRNGAGKTTALRSIMSIGGVLRTGSIRVSGHETVALPPHRIARLGVSLVPEARRIFKDLTVEENLLVAQRPVRARVRAGAARESSLEGGPARARVRAREVSETEGSPAAEHAPPGRSWSLERVFEVFPLLHTVRHSQGAWLSGGEQQVLAIARALVSNPDLLLLDEPSEGLAPRVVETLVEQLARVQEAGLAMLLAEQHRDLVRELASRSYELDRGALRPGAVPA